MREDQSGIVDLLSKSQLWFIHFRRIRVMHATLVKMMYIEHTYVMCAATTSRIEPKNAYENAGIIRDE